MALPPSFTTDPISKRLAAHFEEVYGYLTDSGVPEERLPNPWHVLSHAVQCIDHERLKTWVDSYIAIEAAPEGAPEPVPMIEPREHRPSKWRASYLRMLDQTAEKCEDETDEDQGAP